MSEVTMIPYYSLIPNQITLFEQPDIRRFSDRKKESFENLKDNENKYYELSSHSRKRIKRAIEFLIYVSKSKTIRGQILKSKSLETEIVKDTSGLYQNKINFKLSFITLTLSAPQHNTDEEIKSKLLNNFLTNARRKWKMKDYIWKAEKQQNGNIHFHILTNIFINHKQVREEWNKIQNKPSFEYVNIYSQNMQAYFKNGFQKFPNDKRSYEKQFAAYTENKLTNWTNPNSTDIHSLYKIKNISAYMSKYLAKSVTKTDRVQELEKLYTEKEVLINQYSQNEIQLLFSDSYESSQDELKQQIVIIDSKIEELKKQGVSGKIWAQSQSLSHFTNFIDCQPWDRIPDIEYIMNNYEYMNEIEIGRSKILTYKFNIENTKQLKQLLDEHIKNIQK